MADIVYTYTPADGVALSTDGLNRDIDSATDTESIYGELRGNIENANLVSGFQVRAEHIRRREAWKERYNHGRQPLEFFHDLFCREEIKATFFPIPDASVRVYLPQTYKVVFWWAQTYTHVWRLRERFTDEEIIDAPTVLIRAYRGTTSKGFTTRLLPESVSTAGVAYYAKYEEKLTRHYNLCVLDEDVAAGWHDMTLRLFMDPNNGSENLDLGMLGSAVAIKSHHKVTFGIRNAGVIAFL